MEPTIKRALHVLVIILIVVGGWIAFTGQQGFSALESEVEQMNVVLDTCRSGAKTIDEANDCLNEHKRNVDYYAPAREWEASFHRIFAGLITLAVAALVWPAFFVARWIKTGRWRRPHEA